MNDSTKFLFSFVTMSVGVSILGLTGIWALTVFGVSTYLMGLYLGKGLAEDRPLHKRRWQ